MEILKHSFQARTSGDERERSLSFHQGTAICFGVLFICCAELGREYRLRKSKLARYSKAP
jgi:hypothetical protein